ncbi:hypothetical protein [Paenibacillus hubeiensis]|uniref:hypothetical protein n=1 Tax=Paenibacillus hubeiensis TaxID=3077330 RepID=UPI001F8F08C5|nr:hypothetical protein PAECIP111890_04963 [Paenibacillus sp. JJ-223]
MSNEKSTLNMNLFVIQLGCSWSEGFFFCIFTLFLRAAGPIFTPFLHGSVLKFQCEQEKKEEIRMVNDVTMIALTVLMFALFWGFMNFCEKA